MAWFYVVFFLGTLVLSAVSCAVSFIFNPPTALFVELSNLILKQTGREPSGWGAGSPHMLVSILWPLTLAPLHFLNFKVLRWNAGAYVALFVCTCLLISFFVLLAKSGPLQLSAYSMEQLATRYRKLRREIESAPRDSWTESQQQRLGHWGGEMHGVMAELGQRIKARQCTEAWVLSNLGEPNKSLKESDAHMGETVPAGQRWLIYYWRGEHDHLVIVLNGEKVSDTRWFMAGD